MFEVCESSYNPVTVYRRCVDLWCVVLSERRDDFALRSASALHFYEQTDGIWILYNSNTLVEQTQLCEAMLPASAREPKSPSELTHLETDKTNILKTWKLIDCEFVMTCYLHTTMYTDYTFSLSLHTVQTYFSPVIINSDCSKSVFLCKGIGNGKYQKNIGTRT